MLSYGGIVFFFSKPYIIQVHREGQKSLNKIECWIFIRVRKLVLLYLQSPPQIYDFSVEQFTLFNPKPNVRALLKKIYYKIRSFSLNLQMYIDQR